VEYCDDGVCLSLCVCLSVIISSKLCFRSSPNFFVHVTCGRGSILLWWRSDMLCTSSFMDDVVFVHKPKLLDVAVQLKHSSHAALDLAINSAQEYPLHPTDTRVYFSQSEPTRPQWACWIFMTSCLHIMSLHRYQHENDVVKVMARWQQLRAESAVYDCFVMLVFRLHHSTSLVLDAACCYVVSLCVLDILMSFAKMIETDWDATWVVDSGGPKEPHIRLGGLDPPQDGTHFWGVILGIPRLAHGW